MILAVDFLWMPFIILKKFPSMPTMLGVLIMKGQKMLSNNFFFFHLLR